MNPQIGLHNNYSWYYAEALNKSIYITKKKAKELILGGCIKKYGNTGPARNYSFPTSD
jgi:hypothetical protein